MSNKQTIEIDVSEVSLEEQIEAAKLAYYRGNDDYMIPQVLRDFAAGKFAKAPVPEIRKPRWADHVQLSQRPNDVPPSFRVEAFAECEVYVSGPLRLTAREAILAFNELFGEKP